MRNLQIWPPHSAEGPKVYSPNTMFTLGQL